MTEVLVPDDPGEPDERLRRVGGATADALGATVRSVAVPADERRLGEAVLRALGAPSSLAAVLRPQHGGWEVVRRATKPVVLVPPEVGEVPARITRVLAPLDGTPEAASAVVDAARFAARDLLVLHVFDPTAPPPLWDQAAHAGDAWGEEFLARWCDRPGTRLALRAGSPGRWVPEVARYEGADLIVLGWSRDLSPAHAATVRRTVADATVPVLLVPVDRAAVSPPGRGHLSDP
jgi:nucleotide-binding universal stress UspA family protein